MFKHYPIFMLLMASCAFPHVALAQSGSTFDLGAYKEFLRKNRDMSAADLLEGYPAGEFLREARSDFDAAAFGPEIDEHYMLSDYEKDLIQRHGFVVTERVRHSTFAEALLDIYVNDLPVYVSSDAILHALHMSYSAILKDLERTILVSRLRTVLDTLHKTLPELHRRYGHIDTMQVMLRDLDVYLAVPRTLVRPWTDGEGSEDFEVFYDDNKESYHEILAAIAAERPGRLPILSRSPRDYDYSQFTVRGHYAQDLELAAYFRAMIWLGRTELYLTPPTGLDRSTVDDNDIRRQIIVSALLVEALAIGGAHNHLREMDAILSAFVGKQDNIGIEDMRIVLQENGIGSAAQLLKEENWRGFQESMLERSFAQQRILSQILYSDATNPEAIQPAAALMLMGQRFVIDSYILGNVVYDNIVYRDRKVARMLPSTLDVLFSLGNDAAAQLLEAELERWPYARNLAGLRYLIDSQPPEFWESSIYNTWLQAIRTLNVPAERESLPRFMKTAAWWHKSMNTQLASWAQLRHDNLLYAKQSYSGGIRCHYPAGYVEPVPEFYAAIKMFADRASAAFAELDFSNLYFKEHFVGYFARMSDIMTILQEIAEKELLQEVLEEHEVAFLQSMIFDDRHSCSETYGGWYTDLHYTRSDGMKTFDRIVADVHTAPTDAGGAPVGWVLHAGTGMVDLAVLVVENCDGSHTAYAGPVTSYYEHTSVNFERLTDAEWAALFDQGLQMRPDFVNLYMANASGESPGIAAATLAFTDVEKDAGGPGRADTAKTTPFPAGLRVLPNFPNPFSRSTIIPLQVPSALADTDVSIQIFDVSGRPVRKIFERALPAGNYTLRWDAVNDAGQAVQSGSYYYEISIAGHKLSGQMLLQR